MTTCLITNYNNNPQRAIEAALAIYDEVIVHDDGSAVEELLMLKNLEQQYPKLRVIYSPNSMGDPADKQCLGYYKAFKLSSGDIISLCDGDDFFLPGKEEVFWHFKPGTFMVQHPAKTASGQYPSHLLKTNYREAINKHCLHWMFSPTSCLTFSADFLKHYGYILNQSHPKVWADSRLAPIAAYYGEVVTIDKLLTHYDYDPAKPTKTKQYRKEARRNQQDMFERVTGKQISMLLFKILKWTIPGMMTMQLRKWLRIK